MADPSQIILIDPDSEAAVLLGERLKMQGYQVVIAHAPAEGARLALADPPLAVVADLWMPSISGVQLCRLLKTEPATENVPVILRGPDGPRNRFWSERAGAAAYVTRGRMGDLVRALVQAIARAPVSDGFFTTFAPGGHDIRERIAARLDAALFESVIASEVRALGTCGEFDRLFDLFSQFVSRVASYRWLAVSTHQPHRVAVHASPKAKVMGEVRMALGLSEDTRVLMVEDDDAFDDERGPPPIIRPIELGGIRIGQLAFAPREDTNAQDAELATVLANELAGPIRMATLVEESQRLARVDALTGLMNRRAFTGALQTEISRAERYQLPLSFLLLDVDHFKIINDKRGHGAGDMVLSALGDLLGKQMRTTDLVGRWGGEEFVIALSCTDLRGGEIVAERLRAAVEALVVPDGLGGTIPITASFGLAHIEPGDTLELLVDRADRAMYAAKTSGRNRVSVARPERAVVAAA